ncbi:MAG: mevalonate kinase [Candidatus Gottesmanbacteria bacterium]|nr:mevalonate kinase [Candidatus Gottesmanbacteria bacterium]
MTISAPGKLMLFGEHAVVYGYPCITTAVDSRLTATIEPTGDGKVTIDAPGVKDTRFVDGAITLATGEWHIHHNGFRLSTRSPFSGCYGFGSSSAVTVATLKALASVFHADIDERKLFDAAYNIVLSIQGIGSGFDVASAVFGKTLYFVAGGKVIEPLAAGEIPLVVGYTKVKSNTVEIVNMVAEKRKKYPEKVDRIFQGIAKIVDQAKEKMLSGDWERAGRLMDFDQEYLRDLGVSSEKLEALIAAAKRAGAWGAKLSGAGCGDCMIALASPDKRKAVEEAIAHAGGEVVCVKANAQGVRIDPPARLDSAKRAGEAGTTDDQDELFVVVDRNDNILGYKTRRECHHDPSVIHRTVGVLMYDAKGRLLLQKRSMTKDMEPGLWGISAAGHVTRGQSDEEAAHRELKEELGIDVPLTFVKKFITVNDQESERAALYQGVSDGPFRPEASEVSDIKFFEPRQLRLLAASKSLKMTKAAEQTFHEVGIL